MGKDTTSKNWGTASVADAKGGFALNGQGTIYMFRNSDNGDKFLFLLYDIGFGFSFGVKISPKIKSVIKAILSNKNFDDPGSYTAIKANKDFSADDLHLAQGAETSLGVTVLVVGCSTTRISAWPFFQGAPSPGEVNNDYFSGVEITSNGSAFGLDAKANYQFKGIWINLWSL